MPVDKIGSKTADGAVNILGFLDPGWRKPIYPEQMMCHPHARIGVRIELDGLTLAREVIELTSLDGLPDLALRNGFPLIQISVLHKGVEPKRLATATVGVG